MANDAATSRKEWRFFFMLCLASWQDIISRYPVAETASKSLVTMALRSNLISIQDAQSFRNALDKPQELLYNAGGNIADFTIDFDLAVTQPDEAQATFVAEMFDDLALFHTVTEGGDYQLKE